MSTPKNVTQRYLKKAVDESAAEVPVVPAGRFVDLAVLVFAYQTYIRHLEATGGRPGPLTSKGIAMIKRYGDEIINGFNQVVAPLADRPDAGSIRTAINKATRATSPTPIAISYWADALQATMPWLKTRSTIFNSLFTGKVARAARELAAVADEESPATVLNRLAAIAPVSGVTAVRKWIEVLAAEAGAPLSTTESVLTDAETGQNLGQDLQQVNSRIDAATPNTPDAADLQAQRTGLVSKIEGVAKKSKAPSAVLSAAATASTTQRRSTIAERFRLTPEQQEVSETMGKVVVAAGAGSGKCIKEDSLVRTGKGLIPIGEFGSDLDVGKEAPCTENLFGQKGIESSISIYRDGLCKTIKVTTNRGYALEGTDKHPILVLRDAKIDWVKLGDVVEGDFVCIDRRPGLFPVESFRVAHPKRTRMHFNTQIPEELTPQVARLLGYIVSEGCVRIGTHCDTSITTKDPKQLACYYESFDGIITNFKESTDKRNGVVRINFTTLADVHALMDFGLTAVKAHEKEIPLGIMQSPRDVVVAFLRALFDGDGEASCRTVGYASASYTLAHQVQVLLLSFGIVSKLKFKPNQCKGCWNVFITGDNLRTFTREIGFNLICKQQLAELSLGKTPNTNIDTIPGLALLCRTAHDECKANGDAHWDDPQHGRHRCYWEGTRNPPVDGLREFLDVFQVASVTWNQLDQLTKEPWFYDPVDTIEESEAEVFDFVVPGTHSFSANGFVCHNTTTLVATIANLVENKGYSPDQIMTCSFTRAASAELGLKLERDGKVSGVISGTTHRIARDIIIRHRPNWVNAMRNQRGADKCFKVAYKQVEMSVEGFNKQLEEQKKLIQRIEAIPGWRGKDILRSFHEQASKGRPLSPKQIDVITKFEGGSWRRWAEQVMAPAAPLAKPTQQDWMKLAVAAPVPASIRTNSPEFTGNFGEDEDTGNEEVPKPIAEDGKKSKYDQAPIGMWFNLGVKVTNQNGEKLGERAALLAVDNFKNSGITVDQAKTEFGITPVVALYGAYEWLKLNDPVNGPAMDYTDQLAVALSILEDDPQALAAEQSRYKVIMVDEAQDLNQIQFEMFNLMGAKADLLAFIGDDKQSIYAFRGAKPSNYIDLSKADGYQTKLMTTNFRSGSEIVQAANRLIAHNEDRQIPMVCKAYEARGTGAISALSPATHEDAANVAAQQIKDGVDAGETASDFGILVRNNAESDAYTLALIVRGVPYRCLKAGQGGYFAKPVVRALTAWTRLAIGGSTADINDAVVTAHQTPGFFLDKMFAANLGRMAKGGNYYDYIAGGGEVYTGDQAWRNRNVAAYVDAIRKIKVLGRGDSAALIHAILDLKGSKDTFVESLMKMVDEDDVVEEEGGEGGEEAIRQAALAPVRPLMLMAENFSDPENMLAFIAKMKAANEKVEKKSPDTKDDWKEPAVLVGTVHGWKGLETKHVFVSMAGGVFPNFRSDRLAEEQEAAGQTVTAYDEERRLAYVAITRGKDTTTILTPMKTYLGKPADGSVFIGEACIPMQGDSKGEPGVTEYAADDESLHPDRVASAKTADTFVDSLVTSMESSGPSAGIISEMAL